MNAPARHKALPLPAARLLSRPEAAAYAGVSASTFDKMMADGLMPPPVRVYARTLWDVRQLDMSIDALLDSSDSLNGDGSDNNDWD